MKMKALIESVSLLIHAVSNGDTKTEKKKVGPVSGCFMFYLVKELNKWDV